MKLLASDFDGTLLVDKKINKRDIEGIKALRKKGHKSLFYLDLQTLLQSF